MEDGLGLLVVRLGQGAILIRGKDRHPERMRVTQPPSLRTTTKTTELLKQLTKTTMTAMTMIRMIMMMRPLHLFHHLAILRTMTMRLSGNKQEQSSRKITNLQMKFSLIFRPSQHFCLLDDWISALTTITRNILQRICCACQVIHFVDG